MTRAAPAVVPVRTLDALRPGIAALPVVFVLALTTSLLMWPDRGETGITGWPPSASSSAAEASSIGGCSRRGPGRGPRVRVSSGRGVGEGVGVGDGGVGRPIGPSGRASGRGAPGRGGPWCSAAGAT